MSRYRNGYEIIAIHMDEQSPAWRTFRLLCGAHEGDWFSLGDHWLDAFEYPSRHEAGYPFQSRDDSITRLYGA